MPILAFLDLSVLDLGPMYARQTDVRQHLRFMPRLLEAFTNAAYQTTLSCQIGAQFGDVDIRLLCRWAG